MVKALWLLFLALTSTAAAAQGGSRSLSEAINVAVDQCVASAFRTEATLDGRIAAFIYAEGALPSVMSSRGWQTTAQLPDLIQRFAATSRFSSLFGHRDVIAIDTDDGQVWLVTTADPRFCDIAVTGVEDADGIAAHIGAGVTSNEGWSAVNNAADEMIWSGTFVLASDIIANETPRASISVSGLSGALADASGIQAELNFAAVETASTPRKN
jgi:hypothetical protein